MTCREMALQLEKDLPNFMDRGLDKLTEPERARMKEAYAPYLASGANWTAGAAREITDWLDGRYTVTKDLFLTQ